MKAVASLSVDWSNVQPPEGHTASVGKSVAVSFTIGQEGSRDGEDFLKAVPCHCKNKFGGLPVGSSNPRHADIVMPQHAAIAGTTKVSDKERAAATSMLRSLLAGPILFTTVAGPI